MGVSSTTNRLAYAGDNTTVTFSFPYYFFSTTDILVFVYNTLTGVITQKNLGSGFTISGTPNYQGLYSSGANVVMTVAPTDKEYLVIVRNPPETQTFSVLENGILSSTAIVQQMDYLTLLIQRLEDQVTRCLKIPDGLAASIDMTLPDNSALLPNSFPQLNSSSNGWLLSNTATWQYKTFLYTDLQTGSTSNAVKAFTMPPGYIFKNMAIKHSIQFAGTSISDMYVQVGLQADASAFLNEFDVAQTVADGTYDNAFVNYIGSWANSTDVYLNAVSVGANLSALTAGSVTLYYQLEKVA